MWFFYQAKSQSTDLFGKNAETLFANSAQVQVFALNDAEGQEYVEKRLGGPRAVAQEGHEDAIRRCR